ncbi:MAG: hypothetical protein IJJ14_05300 [Coriobacteriales bacterium]|nr:hypothetical protein [Coriobacteriales bacterium]
MLHPTEVRADLQRYFNLNIERMGKDFSVWQVAACVCCLPLGSATLTAIDPRNRYTIEDFLLHRIGDFLAHEHVPYPWEAQHDQPIADFGSATVEEFIAWRNKEWRDTDGYEQ